MTENEISQLTYVLHNGTHLSYLEAQRIARFIINAGYRKASDVAAEIFAKVSELLNTECRVNERRLKNAFLTTVDYRALCCTRDYLQFFGRRLDELKKKYTESEGA